MELLQFSAKPLTLLMSVLKENNKIIELIEYKFTTADAPNAAKVVSRVRVDYFQGYSYTRWFVVLAALEQYWCAKGHKGNCFQSMNPLKMAVKRHFAGDILNTIVVSENFVSLWRFYQRFLMGIFCQIVIIGQVMPLCRTDDRSLPAIWWPL